MNGLNLLEATISELSPLIRDRKLSPVELTQACIGQCERLDPTLHAFITMTPEYALQRAKEAEQEIGDGHYRGPLHGIPYTLKDVIATHGIRTTWGNPGLTDFKPAEHATVHTLLEEAGAVLLGKVYSHIGRGDNPVMCHSPWDPTTSPGTTSSGSGAAVASGMGFLSMGTDTGGSVRHPASNCGLVGFKATFGRISRYGVWATSWTTDQAGPMTKTVEDNAIAMEALAVFDPKDPVSINLEWSGYRSSIRDGIRGLKVGLPVDSWVWKEWIGQDEEDAIRKAVAVLEELGAEIVEVAIPLAYEARNNSLAAESLVWLQDNFSRDVLDGWEELRPQMDRAKDQTFAEYLHGQQKRMAIRREAVAVLKQADVIAMPTGSTIGDEWDATAAKIRGKTVPARSRAVYLNGMASQTGLPAISIPCGFAKEGRFPVGLQLIGRDLDEALLLRVAYAYEQAAGWHTKHPPV
jgi:aspartyl-tRNA(Asn)/glutamyl-tRNA(Gln) amidotransferase subunit A